MDVRHTDTSPVFIIGYGSSGTTIFSQLVRRYLKISFGTESQFIHRYFNRLHTYGDLREDGNLRRLIADIGSERCFSRWAKFGFAVDENRIFDNVKARTYRGVLESFFGALASHQSMTRWGDKTPEDVYHLDVVRQLFPDAKYVHLVRDGRDVALSVFGRYFGPKNAFCAARVWKDAICRIQQFAKTVDRDQILEVRYEDLLSDPATVFARLIQFLKIADDDNRLRTSIESTIKGDLKESNSYKWKTGLTAKQRQIFERVAGHELRQYGYETDSPADDRVTIIDRTYWVVDDRIRRWLIPAYWRDNTYRFGLRVKDARMALRSWSRRAL